MTVNYRLLVFAIALFTVSIFLSMPLAAQSPMIASRIARQDSMGCLVYVGENSGPLYEGLHALLRADELVEMGLEFYSVQTTSKSYAQLAKELGLRADSFWALTDVKGRCLFQGNKLPAAATLRDAMEAAGVKSPIKILRDFLKAHPDHLDARTHLLHCLRRIAEDRTKRALGLDIKNPLELIRQGDIEGWYSLRSNSIHIDTAQLEDKKLDPGQDIQIWGPYAQELQALFTSGDWRLTDLYINALQIPIEACSPTMIQIYRRHLTKVEACLEEYPSSRFLWQTYAWMRSIAKQGSVGLLLDRLIPSPENALSWPIPQVLSLKISEAREKGDWELLAATLWQVWPDIRLNALSFAGDVQTSRARTEPRAQSRLEVMWRDNVKPLLESLIKTNHIAESETVIMDLVKTPAYRSFQQRAADLALECGREDLRDKWSALQIPEKNSPDMDDLDVALSAERSSTPSIVVINTKWGDGQQINATLKQSNVIDWRLGRVTLNSEISELLRQRMGWPENETFWALFDAKRKILGAGPGLPTAEAICQILEQFSVETPASALRRFVSDYPAHIKAKVDLLGELKRLAEQKTREALGQSAGADTALMLTEVADQEIWGEYASLYHSVLPYALEQGREWAWADGPAVSDFFIHSQKMMTLAHSLLPRVEACLKRQPTDGFLWSVWDSLSDLGQYRNFRSLRETLILSPIEEDPLNLPPPILRTDILRRRVARSDWQMVIDIQEWRWEAMRYNLELNPRELNPRLWREIEPLLEAYLNMEKNNYANELVRVWRHAPTWERIKQDAIGLAEKHEKNALAEQWKKL